MPLVLLILLALLLPGSAAAAPNAEVAIMDDQLLFNEPDPAVLDRYMSRFRWLGAERLRVSAFWDQIAPKPGRRHKPRFDAASPTDPKYNFAQLDQVVQAARNHGLKVLISITTPAPLWATGDPSRNDRVWKPNPAEFALFARAIASRYGSQADQFAISNEPNQPGWLRPQSDKHGYYAPHHYRRMVNAAFPAIRGGSPRDTIVVGELAPSGSINRGPGSSIRPLAFLRAFGCISRSFHRLSKGRCRNFKAPRADVIGHHPYSFFTRPTKHSPNRDDAAIGDGRRLLRFLDRLVRRHRLISARGGKLDVDYTEFGYQTDPPDPYAGVSLKHQDRWLQEAARVAWATPRVRSLMQFRLSDGPKLPGSGFDAWREFQTGLLFHNMKPKPSYLSFRQPFVAQRRGRRHVRLWGQVRPGGRHEITVERKKGGRWEKIATLNTTRRGYWQRNVRSRGGTFRYRWGGGKKRTSDKVRV